MDFSARGVAGSVPWLPRKVRGSPGGCTSVGGALGAAMQINGFARAKLLE